jgi:plasmid stability protein
MMSAKVSGMSVLTVTNVPDEVVAELERRAAEHGVSVEDEIRRVLEEQTTRADAEAFKAHLLTLEDTVEDFEVPPRSPDPGRAIAF